MDDAVLSISDDMSLNNASHTGIHNPAMSHQLDSFAYKADKFVAKSSSNSLNSSNFIRPWQSNSLGEADSSNNPPCTTARHSSFSGHFNRSEMDRDSTDRHPAQPFSEPFSVAQNRNSGKYLIIFTKLTKSRRDGFQGSCKPISRHCGTRVLLLRLTGPTKSPHRTTILINISPHHNTTPLLQIQTHLRHPHTIELRSIPTEVPLHLRKLLFLKLLKLGCPEQERRTFLKWKTTRSAGKIGKCSKKTLDSRNCFRICREV